MIWFGSPHFPHHAAPEDAALYADQPKKHREYLGEITGVDRAFGLLRNELTALGIKDNTLVWFNSDNGAMPVGNWATPAAGNTQSQEGGLRECLLYRMAARDSGADGISGALYSSGHVRRSRSCRSVGDRSPAPRWDKSCAIDPWRDGSPSYSIRIWNAENTGTFTNPAGVANKVFKNEE